MRWPWNRTADDIDTINLGVDTGRRSVTCRADVHTYILGATGSGKGSVAANWLKSQSAYIHEGLVKVDFVDLKWGMEAAMYSDALLAGTATDIEQTLAMFKEIREELAKRAEAARGHTRLVKPTERNPRILLVIDEATSLTSAGNKKQTDEAMQLLAELLRVGRAVGLVVVAMSQNPRVQALSVRDLFPQRIALRLASESEARMALGDDAVDAGAAPWRIPVDRPGVGYLADMDSGQIQRFHAAYITDEELRRM